MGAKRFYILYGTHTHIYIYIYTQLTIIKYNYFHLEKRTIISNFQSSKEKKNERERNTICFDCLDRLETEDQQVLHVGLSTPKASLSRFLFLPIFVHSLDKYTWILFTAFYHFSFEKNKKIIYFLVPTSKHKVCISNALTVRNESDLYIVVKIIIYILLKK